MANTKDELVSLIKQWVQVESEMKVLSKELKERRETKKELTAALVDVMKGNEIDCFDISDGKLMYTKNKIRAPLSKKHLFESLGEYLSKSGVPPEEVASMVKHVMDSRGVSTKEGVRLKPNKS
jgi:hypothetical protein